MHLDRIFTICPYLAGSKNGVICKVSRNLLRHIEDIHPDICISRQFEMCHVYISKLQEINDALVISVSGVAESKFDTIARLIYLKE